MLGIFKHVISSVATAIKDAFTGVQIGQAIITGEDKWQDSDGVDTYDLLLADGSVFNGVTYPSLALVYPSLNLPNLPTETGSPFPYKIVADLTGET